MKWTSGLVSTVVGRKNPALEAFGEKRKNVICVAQLTTPLAEIDQRARRRPGRVQVALKHFSHV